MSIKGSNDPSLSTRGLFRINSATTKRSTSNAQNQQFINQLQKKGLIQLHSTTQAGKQKDHVEFDMNAINTHLNKLLQELKSITTGASQNKTGLELPTTTQGTTDQDVQQMISTLEKIGAHLQNSGSALANQQYRSQTVLEELSNLMLGLSKCHSDESITTSRDLKAAFEKFTDKNTVQIKSEAPKSREDTKKTWRTKAWELVSGNKAKGMDAWVKFFDDVKVVHLRPDAKTLKGEAGWFQLSSTIQANHNKHWEKTAHDHLQQKAAAISTAGQPIATHTADSTNRPSNIKAGDTIMANGTRIQVTSTQPQDGITTCTGRYALTPADYSTLTQGQTIDILVNDEWETRTIETNDSQTNKITLRGGGTIDYSGQNNLTFTNSEGHLEENTIIMGQATVEFTTEKDKTIKQTATFTTKDDVTAKTSPFTWIKSRFDAESAKPLTPGNTITIQNKTYTITKCNGTQNSPRTFELVPKDDGDNKTHHLTLGSKISLTAPGDKHSYLNKEDLHIDVTNNTIDAHLDVAQQANFRYQNIHRASTSDKTTADQFRELAKTSAKNALQNMLSGVLNSGNTINTTILNQLSADEKQALADNVAKALMLYHDIQPDFSRTGNMLDKHLEQFLTVENDPQLDQALFDLYTELEKPQHLTNAKLKALPVGTALDIGTDTYTILKKEGNKVTIQEDQFLINDQLKRLPVGTALAIGSSTYTIHETDATTVTIKKDGETTVTHKIFENSYVNATLNGHHIYVTGRIDVSNGGDTSQYNNHDISQRTSLIDAIAQRAQQMASSQSIVTHLANRGGSLSNDVSKAENPIEATTAKNTKFTSTIAKIRTTLKNRYAAEVQTSEQLRTAMKGTPLEALMVATQPISKGGLPTSIAAQGTTFTKTDTAPTHPMQANGTVYRGPKTPDNLTKEMQIDQSGNPFTQTISEQLSKNKTFPNSTIDSYAFKTADLGDAQSIEEAHTATKDGISYTKIEHNAPPFSTLFKSDQSITVFKNAGSDETAYGDYLVVQQTTDEGQQKYNLFTVSHKALNATESRALSQNTMAIATAPTETLIRTICGKNDAHPLNPNRAHRRLEAIKLMHNHAKTKGYRLDMTSEYPTTNRVHVLDAEGNTVNQPFTLDDALTDRLLNASNPSLAFTTYFDNLKGESPLNNLKTAFNADSIDAVTVENTLTTLTIEKSQAPEAMQTLIDILPSLVAWKKDDHLHPQAKATLNKLMAPLSAEQVMQVFSTQKAANGTTTAALHTALEAETLNDVVEIILNHDEFKTDSSLQADKQSKNKANVNRVIPQLMAQQNNNGETLAYALIKKGEDSQFKATFLNMLTGQTSPAAAGAPSEPTLSQESRLSILGLRNNIATDKKSDTPMHQLLESYELNNGTDTHTCNDIFNGLTAEYKVRALGICDSEGTPASHIDALYMDQLFKLMESDPELSAIQKRQVILATDANGNTRLHRMTFSDNSNQPDRVPTTIQNIKRAFDDDATTLKLKDALLIKNKAGQPALQATLLETTDTSTQTLTALADVSKSGLTSEDWKKVLTATDADGNTPIHVWAKKERDNLKPEHLMAVLAPLSADQVFEVLTAGEPDTALHALATHGVNFGALLHQLAQKEFQSTGGVGGGGAGGAQKLRAEQLTDLLAPASKASPLHAAIQSADKIQDIAPLIHITNGCFKYDRVKFQQVLTHTQPGQNQTVLAAWHQKMKELNSKDPKNQTLALAGLAATLRKCLFIDSNTMGNDTHALKELLTALSHDDLSDDLKDKITNFKNENKTYTTLKSALIEAATKDEDGDENVHTQAANAALNAYEESLGITPIQVVTSDTLKSAAQNLTAEPKQADDANEDDDSTKAENTKTTGKQHLLAGFSDAAPLQVRARNFNALGDLAEDIKAPSNQPSGVTAPGEQPSAQPTDPNLHTINNMAKALMQPLDNRGQLTMASLLIEAIKKEAPIAAGPDATGAVSGEAWANTIQEKLTQDVATAAKTAALAILNALEPLVNPDPPANGSMDPSVKAFINEMEKSSNKEVKEKAQALQEKLPQDPQKISPAPSRDDVNNTPERPHTASGRISSSSVSTQTDAWGQGDAGEEPLNNRREAGSTGGVRDQGGAGGTGSSNAGSPRTPARSDGAESPVAGRHQGDAEGSNPSSPRDPDGTVVLGDAEDQVDSEDPNGAGSPRNAGDLGVGGGTGAGWGHRAAGDQDRRPSSAPSTRPNSAGNTGSTGDSRPSTAGSSSPGSVARGRPDGTGDQVVATSTGADEAQHVAAGHVVAGEDDTAISISGKNPGVGGDQPDPADRDADGGLDYDASQSTSDTESPGAGWGHRAAGDQDRRPSSAPSTGDRNTRRIAWRTGGPGVGQVLGASGGQGGAAGPGAGGSPSTPESLRSSTPESSSPSTPLSPGADRRQGAPMEAWGEKASHRFRPT